MAHAAYVDVDSHISVVNPEVQYLGVHFARRIGVQPEEFNCVGMEMDDPVAHVVFSVSLGREDGRLSIHNTNARNQLQIDGTSEIFTKRQTVSGRA